MKFDMAEARHFAADTYLSFVFWTVLTSLGMCIWYFPLWHMGISGYEVALFADISPVLLGVPAIRRMLRRHRGISAALGLIGIAAYTFANPAKRLLAVAAGTAGVMLHLGAALYVDRAATGRLERDIQAWEAGLLASVAVRMFFHTNNPAWPTMNAANGGWNGTALALGLLALADVVTRRPAAEAEVHAAKKHDLPPTPGQHVSKTTPWAKSALGLGALLFTLHSLFSDSAILGRWTWEGYPETGPAPVPWGGLVLSALAAGFAAGHCSGIATSTLWWGIGSAGAAAVTFVGGWAGFVGGLALAVYTGTVSRSILRAAAHAPPGRTLLVGAVWYNVLVLAHVWVVAYEFVPGGPLMRERTWVVMAATMLSLYAGVRAARLTPRPADGPAVRVYRRQALGAALVAVVLGWTAMVVRLPAATRVPQPLRPEQRLLTSAIWTVHFDLDNDMWLAEERIMAAIRDLEVDVMGFLESDTERIIMGQRDWTQRVGEELGYYVDYGPSPRKHTWGCAMISKFPIKNSTHHLLPSPVGELACAIHATLDVHGRDVDVIISHNGQEENPLDRRLQTAELARIMNESQNPLVFTGYVVTKPHARNYKLLFDGGRIHDIDPTDSDRWCQYIGYRGLKRVGYARVSRGTITDTEIQVGKFVVPALGEEVPEQPSYTRVPEKHYAAEYHFPTKFRGRGVRGHFYHVFKEPRYFE
ncbi:Protein cwh43 [Coemansia sp. RSA 1085]|nr:integral plasma membrane protein [Coemansia mojavensis]KAJ1738479.1 Protein cwh43 [Coemansia sp. RSA 1086]KAJ2649312.1 Protein cwh43 [Coemansia sp. RSA 1250]KAJ2672019.1 Protein cwh43 [Coemansia sp. RSA 1085]